jgi:hypothetical protein
MQNLSHRPSKRHGHVQLYKRRHSHFRDAAIDGASKIVLEMKLGDLGLLAPAAVLTEHLQVDSVPFCPDVVFVRATEYSIYSSAFTQLTTFHPEAAPAVRLHPEQA